MITARNAELGHEVAYSQVLGLESKFMSIFLRLQDRCIVLNIFVISGFSKIWSENLNCQCMLDVCHSCYCSLQLPVN